ETLRDAYFNLVSAPGQGPGVYGLLAGVTTPYINSVVPSAGTNDITHTLVISGGYFLPPLEVVLVGPTASYTLPLGALSPVSITAVVTQGLQAREYQVLAVNLNEPGGAVASPQPGTFALYDPAEACFYDFFESGAGQWEGDGDWGIAILPTGERAMTDSPGGNYDSAIPPAIKHTTAITSQAFSLISCTHPVLAFRHDYVIAQGTGHQDVGRVEISADDGVSWTELASYSGGGVFGLGTQDVESPEWASVDWKEVEIDLSPYTGTVRLRLSLEVDENVSDKGWIIDDLLVQSGALTPRLVITKTVDHDQPDPGQLMTYTIIVQNDGLATATGALISDTLPVGLVFAGPVALSGSSGTLAQDATDLPALARELTIEAGKRITVTFPVTVSAGLVGETLITNTAGLTSAEVLMPVRATALITIASKPALTVNKAANMALAEVGQTITYTYRLTNTGNVTLTGLSASDDKLGPVILTQAPLAPNSGISGTLLHIVGEDDLPGPLTNTVTVSGTPPDGPSVVVTASEVVLLTSHPDLVITKTASVSTAGIGHSIVYTYQVANRGDVTLNDIQAYDDKLGDLTLGLSSLAPGQSTVDVRVHTVVEGDLPGPLTNTVTVTGIPPVGSVLTATATETVTLTASPGITISKTASVSQAVVGQTIFYVYQVTNSGDVTLSDIRATDDKLGALSLSQTTLAPGQSAIDFQLYTVLETDLPGPLTNTATVSGTLPLGTHVTAVATSTVDVQPDTIPPGFAPSSLVEPIGGITLSTRRPAFEWLAAVDNVGVVSYTLALSSSQTLAAQESVINVIVTQSSYTPTVDLPDGVYTWTVQAYDPSGNASGFVSPPESFVISAGGGGEVYLPIILKND
ncbi:MAG: DUF11 domain-containing protein, partial [Anaerolineales bacterium]